MSEIYAVKQEKQILIVNYTLAEVKGRTYKENIATNKFDICQ